LRLLRRQGMLRGADRQRQSRLPRHLEERVNTVATESIGYPPTKEATEPLQLPFRDRVEAGRALAARLAPFRGQHAVVLGIPRGGVPVAREVARAIEGELDIIVARKLGAPFSEELAIGAVTADGARYLNPDVVRDLGVTPEYLERVTATQLAEARRREARFRGGASGPALKDRIVVLVDDGLATGATMQAAVRAVRAAHPRRLVVGVPVAASDTCQALRAAVDELVCLATPEPFYSVGAHYEHFEAVPDAEVEAILKQR
jgi:putative phosphoribosyl transferase